MSRCELGVNRITFWKFSCPNISHSALNIISLPGGLSLESFSFEDKSRNVSQSAPRDSVVILLFTTQRSTCHPKILIKPSSRQWHIGVEQPNHITVPLLTADFMILKTWEISSLFFQLCESVSLLRSHFTLPTNAAPAVASPLQPA